jgi:hypothetical protein
MSRIIKAIESHKPEYLILGVMDVEGEVHFIEVKKDDYQKYIDGALIQTAFPYLTSGQRELMLTGLTESMWSDLIGDEEE